MYGAAMHDIATHFAKIQQELAELRLSAPPCVIGASKTMEVPVLEAAIAAGVRHFGENKIQEAAGKWPALRDAHPDITLHGIGPVQSNKVEDALALFDVMHTIDRPKLVSAIAKARDKGVAMRTKQFLVQVNTGEEPQKAGVLPSALPALLQQCADTELTIDGLMCIPPAGTPAAPHFALLRKLAERHGLRELSMGMSADYGLAARMGATMVRVGTSLFGPRDTKV